VAGLRRTDAAGSGFQCGDFVFGIAPIGSAFKAKNFLQNIAQSNDAAFGNDGSIRSRAKGSRFGRIHRARHMNAFYDQAEWCLSTFCPLSQGCCCGGKVEVLCGSGGAVPALSIFIDIRIEGPDGPAAPCGLQNLPQRENLLLRNEQAVPDWFPVWVIGYRLLSDIECKPEMGNAALLRPMPQSGSGNTFNDVRGLFHVVKPLAVDDVRLGRATRSCFGCWLHPATERHSATDFKADSGGALMAKQAVATPEAGANPTRTAPASANGSEMFQKLWMVYGPFEEAWIGPWNAETWRDSNAWRMGFRECQRAIACPSSYRDSKRGRHSRGNLEKRCLRLQLRGLRCMK